MWFRKKKSARDKETEELKSARDKETEELKSANAYIEAYIMNEWYRKFQNKELNYYT